MKMSAKSILVPLTFFTLLTCSTIPMCRATLITFDDLSDKGGGTLITNNYQSLTWSNFAVGNAVLDRTVNGLSGYYYGIVTASNVALNAHGDPAEIDSPGTNFNFLSAYFTGAWNSNLNIEVEGFSGTSLVYSQVVVASATSPTLFTFDYQNIDRLYFNSFGGQNAGFPSGGGENFAMDNLTSEFVPEPSSFLLTTAAALMLWPILRRKRP